MTANYPYNCWYVAALSEEIGDGLFARKLLGKHVVLYRRESGEVVAMEDRCAHRPHPLSSGRRSGDRIVCAYHGFEYDPDGRLVHVPSQDNVPPGAYVRTYPVREASPFVWIWMGEPGIAGLRPPPRPSWVALSETEGWTESVDSTHVDANFLLLHEHYLDLTNVFFMHPDMVPPDLTTLPPLDEVEVSERSVGYSRLTIPTRPAQWEIDVTGVAADSKGPRLEQGIFVSPALHVQRYVIDPDGERFTLQRIHAFTPETPGTTHVFVRISRDYARDDSAVTAHLQAVFHEMTMRDAAAVETIQARIDEETEPRRNVNVKADRAALRARRITHDMVDEESGYVLRSVLMNAR